MILGRRRRCVVMLRALPLMVANLTACVSGTEAASASSSLTGRWELAYPSTVERQWLLLSADSSAEGTFTYNGEFESLPPRAWKLGAAGMPEGLCFTFGDKTLCQGYALRGDTLWLADDRGSVFVRGGHGRSPLEPGAASPRKVQPVAPGAASDAPF